MYKDRSVGLSNIAAKYDHGLNTLTHTIEKTK